MSRYSLLLLFLLPWSAQAVICKSVDVKGGVTYSDVPAGECRHPVKLPEMSRYAPPSPGEGAPPPRGAGTTDIQGPSGAYTEMRIEQPSAGGTVRSNEGKVPVAVYLMPTLRPGHYLQLVLDGTPVEPPVATLGSTLTDVTPGTHSLSARVVDAEGRVLYSAGSIPFTLHREAKEPATPPPSPEGAFQPDYVPPATGRQDFQPTDAGQPFAPAGDKPDYRPRAQPDYSPNKAPIQKAPNSNHPAFAPQYRP